MGLCLRGACGEAADVMVRSMRSRLDEREGENWLAGAKMGDRSINQPLRAQALRNGCEL